MQPIIKSLPARSWALDLIGLIHPQSSAYHKFIIFATNFFTKCVEVESLKEASVSTVHQFIFRNILYRFGIPECLVTDRGATFIVAEVNKLIIDFGIQFLHSTPYYTQSNGRLEANNKIIISIVKKMLADNAKDWYNELDSTL